MALRPLTSKEIEDYIAGDQIVWVACRKPSFGLTQGKFMRGNKPLTTGSKEYPYSFCPFKRGLKTGFLPAEDWLIDDNQVNEDHDAAVAEALRSLKAARKK
ncbi:hypothetical protein [Pseudobacteriovorax antillogorgiicola]|uniref:Uncharacterized protein n=1 Tax=Pseudobacteriovorax antillogorgiicola TaxID=1513793 RepID=A0A1Y6C8V4_9BACT|nr:hypothetical protein [Pseudobacteriovorax antillogorgiicola]TCS49822.1 hypothetical protein EDD56_11467 [Pseudobacteriovorax antillogorgiicola]SMF43282.1 hypothetical protein SAMN06296036_11366 [Pseudobacteriovorax antillogorgiicola]